MNVQFALTWFPLVCISPLSKAISLSDPHRHMQDLVHDSFAPAKVMMRRQDASDQGKHLIVTAAASFSETAKPAAATEATKSKSVELTSMNQTANRANATRALEVAGKSTTSSSTVGVLEVGKDTAAHSSLSSAADKPECFVAKGLKVITVKGPKGEEMDIAIREDQDVVSRALERQGYYQIRSPEEMAGLADLKMPANGTLLDIGASVGWYTLLFAKAGYKVVAVEPILMNRIALNTTLCLNPQAAANVQVVPVALVSHEDSRKKCIMNPRSKDNQGAGTLVCRENENDLPCSPESPAALIELPPSTTCSGVSIKTLDALLADLAPLMVDFVKIDIDGLECDVLRSGDTVFWRYHVKFLQVTTIHPANAKCFITEARIHGYFMGKHDGEDRDEVLYPPGLALLESDDRELEQPITFELRRGPDLDLPVPLESHLFKMPRRIVGR